MLTIGRPEATKYGLDLSQVAATVAKGLSEWSKHTHCQDPKLIIGVGVELVGAIEMDANVLFCGFGHMIHTAEQVHCVAFQVALEPGGGRICLPGPLGPGPPCWPLPPGLLQFAVVTKLK